MGLEKTSRLRAAAAVAAVAPGTWQRGATIWPRSTEEPPAVAAELWRESSEKNAARSRLEFET